MIFSENTLLNKIKAAPNGSELKIFLFIALNQPSDGIKGFQTTKQQLSFDLNIKSSTIFASLRWLEENLFINELKLDDCSDFMANPYFVMNNSDRKDRIKEWNRRLDLYIQRKNRLRREKQLRELKKQPQNKN